MILLSPESEGAGLAWFFFVCVAMVVFLCSVWPVSVFCFVLKCGAQCSLFCPTCQNVFSEYGVSCILWILYIVVVEMKGKKEIKVIV